MQPEIEAIRRRVVVFGFCYWLAVAAIAVMIGVLMSDGAAGRVPNTPAWLTLVLALVAALLCLVATLVLAPAISRLQLREDTALFTFLDLGRTAGMGSGAAAVKRCAVSATLGLMFSAIPLLIAAIVFAVGGNFWITASLSIEAGVLAALAYPRRESWFRALERSAAAG